MLDLMDSMEIYITFHVTAAEYTFFSRWNISQDRSYVGQEQVNKFKKIELISNIFFDHKDMKPEINYKKKN